MQHYGQQQRPARSRQSPALETPLPEFVPPQGQRGQDIMIIWDFQNVRTPTELEPVEIIRFMYDTFVKHPGPRRCAGAFCTFTDSTKKAVGEKRFNQFCSNGVLNFMMINSPGGPRKADDSDHPLKEMMMNFTVDCVRGSKDGVLLLITADADFVRPAIWCKQQGCVSLELIYYDPIASKEIRQLEANWKMEWRDFLDCMMGRRCPWTLPYPQDVAAGLVPSTNSSNSNYSSYYSNGSSGNSSSGYQQDQQRRYQQQQQQQRQQQLHLPGPPARLALPPPSAAGASASGSRQVFPVAAAATATRTVVAAPVAAVTVSTTHVDQAAEQLLHNPAALQQVMQQYKQSMQTTAVLQQVLQGVASKATGSTPAPNPAAAGAAAGAAAAAAAQAAYMRAAQQQQQQQQQAARQAAPAVYMVQPNKPVTILRRDGSSAAVQAAAGAGAAVGASGAAAGGYTWQQREQASSRLTPDSATGGRSPPPPEWWDPSSASGSKARRNSKGGLPATAAGSTGGGGFSRHGSSNGNLGAGMGESDGNGGSDSDDAGFWDSGAAAGAQASGDGATRSSSSGRLNHAGSGTSRGLVGLDAVGGSSSGTPGDGGVLSPPAGTGLPPPPSMGLMKRAAGAATPGSSSKLSASGGNLAALLAAAAANAGGSSSSPAKAARAGAGHQSPAHQHLGSDHGGVQSSPAVDKHEMFHQQALASMAGGSAGSSGDGGGLLQPRLQQQPQSLGSLGEMRSPSPGLPSNRSDRSLPTQDRHMQHHQQQLMAAMRNSKQRPFHESGDTAAAAPTPERAPERSAAVPTNLFGGRSSGSGWGAEDGNSSSPSDHTGLWARPKGGAAGPGMAAAARILSRATAAAAADAPRNSSGGGGSSHRGTHDGSRVSSASGKAGLEASGVQPDPVHSSSNAHRRSSGTGGGVVEIMEAPPLPPWMQQGQAEQQQEEQEREQAAAAAAGSAGSASGAGEGSGGIEEAEFVYEEDPETGEVILVKNKKHRAVAAVVQPPPQQPPQQAASAPVSIAGAAAARGEVRSGADTPDGYPSSEGLVTPSNTPCSGLSSLPIAAAGARLHLGGPPSSSSSRSRLHQWQQPAPAAADAEDDATPDAAAAAAAVDRAGGSCCSSSAGSSGSSVGQMLHMQDPAVELVDPAAQEDTGKLLSVTISTTGSLNSSSGGGGPAGAEERLVQLQLEVSAEQIQGSSGSRQKAVAADGSSDGSMGSAGVEEAPELLAPLLGTQEGIACDEDAQQNGAAALPPVLSAALLGQPQPIAQPLFPLGSAGLEALVAMSQGYAHSSTECSSGMLPLPMGVGIGADGSSCRVVEGLTLLGPVLGSSAGAGGVRGSSGSSPARHRPKQPSIAEQLEELQHILSADMAAEAEAAIAEDGVSDGGSAAEAGVQDEGLDLSPTAALGSAECSEGGGSSEEGIGFEAVGLDGLPVYGPHLPQQGGSSSEEAEDNGDEEGDEERLLRLLATQQGVDAAGSGMSVERMLELLNAGGAAQAVPISASLVVSGPPMPLQGLSSSPVTAIEELGNVTSPSSAGSKVEEGQGSDVGAA